MNNIVSKKDKVQDININQLKLEVHDTHKEDEEITTNFELANIGDVINKVYLHANSSRIEGQNSFIEKDYNYFKILSDKLSKKEVLIQRAVKTTIEILCDRRFLFDSFPNADKVLKDFSFVKRCRHNFE